MTAVEWHRRVRGKGSHQAGSWGLSVVVHLFVVGCAVRGFMEMPTPVTAEAFRWEVAVVQPTTAPPVEEPPSVQPPETPKVSPPVPQSHRPMPQPVATPLPVAEPQQRRTPVVASLQEVRDPIERPVQTEMQTEMAVETVEKTSVSTEREVSHRATAEQAEPVARPMETVTPTETVSSSVQQVVESQTSAAVQHRLMPGSEMAVEQAEPSVEARPVEHARMSRAMPAVQQVSVNEEAPSVIERRVVKERPLRAFPETQADYGWLSDTLWGRIEQLKRYPSLARNNHWEGRVLVEAVIQDDGAIIESQIAESSGHAVLDQQALMVLKQASPLALKHPLGQRRVTILVPITYRLDG